MKTTGLLILTAFLLILSCCTKKEKTSNSDQPPPGDKDGPFVCYVNGERWVAQTPSTIGGAPSIMTEYDEETGGLNVTANRIISGTEIFQSIYFYVPNVKAQGTYQLYTGSSNNVSAYTDLKSNICSDYVHDASNPGTLTVTKFDPDAKKIEASFSFVAVSKNCNPGSSVTISNGKLTTGY